MAFQEVRKWNLPHAQYSHELLCAIYKQENDWYCKLKGKEGMDLKDILCLDSLDICAKI